MFKQDRMKELKKAKELIFSASPEEKEELFKDLIEDLQENKKRFKDPDNRFDTYEDNAYIAMDRLRIFVRSLGSGLINQR